MCKLAQYCKELFKIRLFQIPQQLESTIDFVQSFPECIIRDPEDSKNKNSVFPVLNITIKKELFLQIYVKLKIIHLVIQIQLVRHIMIIIIIIINTKIDTINKLNIQISTINKYNK